MLTLPREGLSLQNSNTELHADSIPRRVVLKIFLNAKLLADANLWRGSVIAKFKY